MTQSERFGIIERLLLARRSIGFADLQDHLGISRATLYRDLTALRDRMNVPIIHDRETNSYRIDSSVERYELPGVWFSAGEIHALLSMQQLLAAQQLTAPGRPLDAEAEGDLLAGQRCGPALCPPALPDHCRSVDGTPAP